MPFRKTGSGKSIKKKKVRRKEVAGPYRDQSSVKSIREDAQPSEHRKVPVKHSSSKKKVRRKDPFAVASVAKTLKEAQAASKRKDALYKKRGWGDYYEPKKNGVAKLTDAHRSDISESRDQKLAAAVDLAVTQPLEKAGYHKSTGQKIYEKIAEWGPTLIMGGPELKAGMKALQATTRGIEASGIRVGGTKALRSVVKPTNVDGISARAAAAERQGAKAAAKEAKPLKKVVGKVTRAQSKADKRLVRKVTGTQTRREYASQLPVAAKAAKAGAAQTLPVVRGHEQALIESPGNTLKTTGRMLPGLVTVPAGMVADVGLTVGRAASTDLHAAHVPGFKSYTGKEIIGPVADEVKAQIDFAVQVAKVVTSDDSAEVQKAVESELGLMLPIMLGLSGGAVGKKISKGRIEANVRRIAERARERAGSPHGKFRGETPHVFEKAVQRKGEANRTANARLRIRREVADRTENINKAGKKAKGSEVVRKDAVPTKKFGVRGRKDLEISTEDIVPFAVRHGLPLKDPAKALAEVKRIKSTLKDVPEGMELPADRLSTRDLIDYIERNPESLADPHLRQGVIEWKRQASEARRIRPKEDRPLDITSPDHSERARFSSTAVTRGIAFPEERALHELRIGDAKTWDEVGNELEKVLKGHDHNVELARKQERIANSGKEQALKTRERLRRRNAKKHEAGETPTTKETRDLSQASGTYRQSKIRAKQAREDRYAAEKERKALQRQIKAMRDAGAGKRTIRPQLSEVEKEIIKGEAPDDLKAALRDAKLRKQKEASKKLTKEFTGEVKAQLRAEGMELPEYVNTSRAKEQPTAGANAAPIPQFPGKSKFKTGAAERHGIVEEGLAPSIRRSISQPVARRESYKAMIGFLSDNELRLGDKTEFTSAEARKLFDSPNNPIGRHNYVMIPRQLYKRSIDTFSPEDAAATIKVALDEDDPKFASRKYKIVRKAAAEEFLDQMTNKLVSPAITKANQLTSMLILGTSPAWAVMQVLAEYGQGALAQPRLLNPKFIKKAIKSYNSMDKRQKLALESWSGVVTRTIDSPDELKLNLESGDVEAMGEAHKVITSILRFDKWKGGKMRLLVNVAKIDQDLNGRAKRFERGLVGMDREMGKALEATKGKSLTEQLNYVAEHPELAKKYQTYLDDVMGNWSALTKNERVAAQMVVFFPFLRMSFRWALYSFPKHHPIKAAIGMYLGQQNANELTKLLHGDPSFFKWGQVPVHLGNGETKIIDFSRMAPASNALIEGTGDPSEVSLVSALRIVQPPIGALVTGITGVNAFTGEKEPNGAINAIASLMSLPSPVRLADEFLTPEGEKKDDKWGRLPIVGLLSTEKQEALDKLFNKLDESGSVNKAVRTLALPTLPKNTKLVADTGKVGRILDTMSENSSDKQQAFFEAAKRGDMTPAEARKKVEEMKKLSSEASNELNAMFRKYNIPYKKEEVRDKDIYGQVIYGSEPDKPTSIGGTTIGGVNKDNDLGRTTIGGQELNLPKAGTERRPGKKARGTTIGGESLGKIRKKKPQKKKNVTTIGGVPLQ